MENREAIAQLESISEILKRQCLLLDRLKEQGLCPPHLVTETSALQRKVYNHSRLIPLEGIGDARH